MKLNNLIKDFRFDKRLVEWNLINGVVNKEEYEQYLQSLSDLSDSKEEVLPPDIVFVASLKKC